MARRELVVALALALSGGSAYAADPLTTPECRKALDALHAHEAAMPQAPAAERGAPSAERRAALARLAGLRRQAATACLHAADDATPPNARFSPPIAVPPVAAVPPSARPLPAQRPAAPVRPPQPPLTVMSCDAAGCWASDGTRLQRAGPNLLGPRGFCTTAGTLLQCP